MSDFEFTGRNDEDYIRNIFIDGVERATNGIDRKIMKLRDREVSRLAIMMCAELTMQKVPDITKVMELGAIDLEDAREFIHAEFLRVAYILHRINDEVGGDEEQEREKIDKIAEYLSDKLLDILDDIDVYKNGD